MDGREEVNAMAAGQQVVPPLVDGDRLTAEEFMRRWEAMPQVRFAELIEGEVFVGSPLRLGHGIRDFLIANWLGAYVLATPGCDGMTNATWRMGGRDVPQPDLALRILPGYGGQSHEEGEYAAGAPELIIEVSGSTTKLDLGRKLRLYERMGVREYIVMLLQERRFAWHELVGGHYRLIQPDPDGLFRSRFFPGLWLDPEAAFTNDLARVIAAVQRGVQTDEHAAFVRLLEGRRR